MVAIQIRDVPDDVRDALAAEAAERGQSLQGMLLSLLKEKSVAGINTALLQRFDGRQGGSSLTAEATADAIAQARSERDGRTGAAISAGPRIRLRDLPRAHASVRISDVLDELRGDK